MEMISFPQNFTSPLFFTLVTKAHPPSKQLVAMHFRALLAWSCSQSGFFIRIFGGIYFEDFDAPRVFSSRSRYLHA
jgi:hypothetical protein